MAYIIELGAWLEVSCFRTGVRVGLKLRKLKSDANDLREIDVDNDIEDELQSS
jgi:hypothetical protein